MADPASGDAVAQIIAASGAALAGVIGAIVLWPTRRRRERAAETAAIDVDPENRPARMRERLTDVERRATDLERRVEHVEDELPTLRAREVADETLARVVDHVERKGAPRRRT